MTPLMNAAIGEHGATVQALLDAGADKNLSSKNGKTALDMAAGNEEIVNLLQEP